VKSVLLVSGIIAIIIAGSIPLLSGCGGTSANALGDIGSPSSGVGSGATPSPTPGGSPTPPGTNLNATLPFEVMLYSQYDTGGPFTQEVDCQIPTGTAVGTVSACNVAIPEGRLEFSALSWVVNVGTGTNSNGCAVMVYQPYYYQASNTAGFLPTWEQTAIDCSVSPVATGCFSGTATVVVPDFPINGAVYFNVANNTSQTWTLPSARSQSRYSSRWTVNNLAARGGAITFLGGRDAYLANSMVDYQFTCNDAFMQPVYTFTMQITKTDISGGPNVPANPLINQYPDWDPASWDR
jgi:hypothetical protein